ncbi:MAG: glycosyltransferase, partial [Acetatifactor sp.]|nr:glycosyltransferase [Acetatifactor sp.]
SVESVEYLFAQYVVNRQITALERRELLTAVAERFCLDLYTPDQTLKLPNCTNHGSVDYYDFAPYVFKKAKINLNISLRSILSGIPLRAFDIMGAGGFLLTNYQEDFLDLFVPGEDFVFYESKTDLMDKIDYYLKHEAERAQIAENGLRRISTDHTYEQRVAEILSYL